MKKVLLIIASMLFVFLAANCGRTENEAVTSPSIASFSSKDVSGVLSNASVTGLMYTRRNASTVPIEADSALVVISFPKTMRNSATIILKRVTDNMELSVTTTWDIGTNYSTLKIQPTANLDINKRYWLKISASSIADAQGNKWDEDGDGIGGELVDDDIKFYFNTTNGSGGAGSLTDVQQYVVDEWAPEIDGSLFCWVNTVGQTPTTNTYVNSSFYLRLTDELLRVDRTARDTVGPFLGTIDDSRIWLIDGETEAKVPATIALIDDPDVANVVRNSTVRIQPTDRLLPNKTYFVVVQQNKIEDVVGNKMSMDNGIGEDILTYTISTDDSLSDGSVVGADVVGPTFTYASKRITLNELVDESTINGSTIWYKDVSGVERSLVLVVSVEYTSVGKPVTVVTITPMAGYSSGTLYVNLRMIKDVLGNYGTGVNPSTRPL
jgi:hypothetical protein